MNISLVLGGGVALGAYQAGAYAALHEHPELRPARIAGTSVGAVAGAIILGNAPAERVAGLRAFWDEAAVDTPWSTTEPLGDRWRRASARASIVQVRTFGRPGFFNPRWAEALLKPDIAIYDHAPLRERLERTIDFERLNRASFSVTTTDIETGEAVVFDTRRGERITADHLIASCGFLPDFPPVEIGGRLLGDGGLVANTPVAYALDWEHDAGDWTVLVLDLFACASERPARLEEAAGRRADLLLGNQTRQALRLLELERATHKANLSIVRLAYRAPSYEGGVEKPFNFGRSTLAERWAAGEHDMAQALHCIVTARVEPEPARTLALRQ